VSLDDAGGVLTPDELICGERAHSFEQFRLAVANVLRRERVRRLHRHERENLEQVILDHVAQRPGLLVVAAAAFDARGLGHCDLDMVDRVAAPRPLDHRVGKPEDQDVLHRLLPHVMVDPEDPRLFEDLAHDSAEPARARQVVPDRLLEHDPRVRSQARLADPPDDRRERRGRRGAIEQQPTLRAELGVERHESLAQYAEGVRVVEWRRDVGEPSRERLPAPLVQPVAGEPLDPGPGVFVETRVADVTPARTDDRAALRQQALVGQVVERRKQLTASQIAGRAEDDQRLGWRRDKCHGAQPSRRSRL
jgi:hypothetical protein